MDDKSFSFILVFHDELTNHPPNGSGTNSHPPSEKQKGEGEENFGQVILQLSHSFLF